MIRLEQKKMKQMLKKKTIEKINETKSCFFEKVKIGKPLARLINKKTESIK